MEVLNEGERWRCTLELYSGGVLWRFTVEVDSAKKYTGLRWSILTLPHSVKLLHLSPVCIVHCSFNEQPFLKEQVVHSNEQLVHSMNN